MDALHRVRITSLIHQTKLKTIYFNIAELLSCKNLYPIHSYLYTIRCVQITLKLWEISK